jgi:PilZ domain-containing protein
MRRFPRFNRSMHVNLTTENSTCHGRTIDVSEQGARLATRDPFDVGQKINMELYLRETDPFPIRLVGECRWSRTENNETVTGVDLTHSKSHSLAVLRAYIAQATASDSPQSPS